MKNVRWAHPAQFLRRAEGRAGRLLKTLTDTAVTGDEKLSDPFNCGD